MMPFASVRNNDPSRHACGQHLRVYVSDNYFSARLNAFIFNNGGCRGNS